MYENLVKTLINDYNAEIKSLILPCEYTGGTGVCNSCIFVENDKIHLIMRHVEYSLYHCEGEQKYQSCEQGPLSYYHREDKNELKTNNYYCELDNETLEIKRIHKIDTSKLDKKPIWTFVGLEDARMVKWDNKYYLCGVRRDTTTNGQGRTELSEIIITDENVSEINRNRIEVPDTNSYCEKNWMPILSKPYHFVKWTNPTEIVKVNLEKDNCKIILSDNKINKDLVLDVRGGSSLIDWYDNTYLCITHEVDFTLKNQNGFKNADYYHRFVVFDRETYEKKYISEPFNFMTGKIEFCIGLAEYNNNILITFGFQDNSSYLIKISNDKLNNFIKELSII
jgi:predicted GH43/DUF377 family glycosyl hydrolase